MEENYHFFADLLTTFRSVSDLIKALIIIVPGATLIISLWVIYHRPKAKSRPPDDATPQFEHTEDAPKG